MNVFFNAEAQRRRGRKGFCRCRNLKFWRPDNSLRLCASALIIFGVEIAARADDAPLSRVAGETVEVADATRAAAKGGYAIRDAESAERALREAEDFALLVAEARRAGLFDDPEIVRTVRSLAVQKLLAREAESVTVAEPDEAAARAWYEANKAEFTRPAVCRGRILAISKDAKDWEARRDGAAALLATNAPAAFGQAVKAWSTDAAARANGGLTTWLADGGENRRYAPEAVAALFAQERDGAVAGPIETDRAVLWVQRMELRSGSVTPFEAARPGIARRMEQQARREAYAHFVEGLRSAATVERTDKAAEILLESAQGEGRPPAGPGPATE